MSSTPKPFQRLGQFGRMLTPPTAAADSPHGFQDDQHGFRQMARHRRWGRRRPSPAGAGGMSGTDVAFLAAEPCPRLPAHCSGGGVVKFPRHPTSVRIFARIANADYGTHKGEVTPFSRNLGENHEHHNGRW